MAQALFHWSVKVMEDKTYEAQVQETPKDFFTIVFFPFFFFSDFRDRVSPL